MEKLTTFYFNATTNKLEMLMRKLHVNSKLIGYPSLLILYINFGMIYTKLRNREATTSVQNHWGRFY